MPENHRRHSGRLVTMGDARIILIGAGVLILAVAGIVLANDVPQTGYLAILAWLAGALIVHDALISGLVFAVALAGRRASTTLPLRTILIVQGALAVGAITALLVLPEVVGKAAGSAANPSVLPLDYALNLGILFGILAAAALAGIALHVVVDRSRRSGDLSP